MDKTIYSGLFPVYQSASSETVKQHFIVRKVEFNRIIESLKRRKSGDSLQHELILGRRGSGKSTLLKRIEVEISDDAKLAKEFIAINFAEEQAGIYRLFDLWEAVLQELYNRLNIDRDITNFSKFRDNQEYTRYLYQCIHECCRLSKKHIVLLLDNFDRIVENMDDDGHLLREELINYNDIILIAASTRMDEHFWRYDKPFYEFFRKHHLNALSSDEAKELLIYWSREQGFGHVEKFVRNNPGKLENVRLLTDGLPRTMYFFMEIILQSEKPTNVDFLKKIMDDATPQYQERLSYLTSPQRKIVLEMAFFWEACSTKQLAEKCRMESKLVSAYLKELESKGVIQKIETNKRNNLYRIAERFFNMWLIVTQGNPEQKRRARWLSIFLESWYNSKELETITNRHITNLKSHQLKNREAVVLTKALSQSRYISVEERDEMLGLTKGLLTESNKLVELPDTIKNITEKALQYTKESGKKDRILLFEIWNGIFDNVEQRLIDIFRENTENQDTLLYELLVQQQKSLVYNAFTHPEFGEQLQHQYAVLYYVCMILNGYTDNNLMLKIPPELESTINDVLETIKDSQELYQ